VALAGSDKAYLQARSGIARSGASRSNYVWPLLGVVTVDGLNVTSAIEYGSLRVTLALNEEPDTCSFNVRLTDGYVESALVVGAEVLIGLGGPAENAVFGGRILTAQTTRPAGPVPSLRSVMCADYLQVLDSEYLITYDWPPQSATVTIKDLIARFANKPGGVAISTAGVQAGLPSHATVAVSNERFSTVLRRLVTMFPEGGGFYVDPYKVLRVWSGVSEPGVVNPSALTLTNPMLKAFAETVDNAQQRDAVIVEGLRTTAPIGSPGPDPSDATGRNVQSMPVLDASILDKVTSGVDREVRVGTQRLTFNVAQGPWSSPPGTPQTTTVAIEVLFNPDPSAGALVQIWIASAALFTDRPLPAWVRIDEQYLKVAQLFSSPSPNGSYIQVPRNGYGAMTGTVHADAVVTVIDSLGSGYVTGRYDAPGSLERVRAQPIDSDVVMTVRSALSSSSVHEQLVQDGRYSRAGASARGTREWQDFFQALVTIQFESDDLNAKPGRLQAYNLPDPVVTGLVGEYMILTAELSWPVWGLPPRRNCTAAEVHAANVLDTWLVDKR
jgi:hypothetical protein